MGSVLLDLSGRQWLVDEGAEDHKQLLKKGAVVVGGKADKAEKSDAGGEPTVKELRKEADALGIAKSVKKKDDLVAAIAAAKESDADGETLGDE